MLSVYTMLFAYFVTQYFFTQTIYSKNKFILLLIFSVATVFITVFFTSPFFRENRSLVTAIGTMPLFYTLILFTIRKSYFLLNHFFITRKWVSQKNTGKDFTYFLWSEHFYWPLGKSGTFHWWDEKLAEKPTILDRLLTGFVLFLPVILSISMFLLMPK